MATTTTQKFGLITAIALIMGNMIGSGVFLLPTSLSVFGWNAVIAWVFTIGGALCLANVFSQLTKSMPDADSPSAMISSALGPIPGFMVSWSYWVSIWTATATIAIAAVSYLTIYIPQLHNVQGLGAMSAIALIWIFAGVNIFGGARTAGSVQIVTVVIKLIPLFVVGGIIAIVLLADGPKAIRPFPAEGLKLTSITTAATLTLWAMLGFESASIARDKVKDPARTIPRATLIGTLATGVIYIFVCSGITLMLPVEIASVSDAPFADFVARYWAPGPAAFIALFASISAIGALNGWSLLQGEVPLTLSRNGLMPAWFGKTNTKGAPTRAIVISAVLSTILLLANSMKGMGEIFTFMAVLSTSAALWLYLTCTIAALRTNTAVVTAAIGTVFAVWTLYGAGIVASSLSLVLMLTGLPFYFYGKRKQHASTS